MLNLLAFIAVLAWGFTENISVQFHLFVIVGSILGMVGGFSQFSRGAVFANGIGDL